MLCSNNGCLCWLCSAGNDDGGLVVSAFAPASSAASPDTDDDAADDADWDQDPDNEETSSGSSGGIFEIVSVNAHDHGGNEECKLQGIEFVTEHFILNF